MFILNKPKEECFNYPKYLILLKYKDPHYLHSKSMFYYLLSSNKRYTSMAIKIPNYLIILDLFFDKYTWYNKDEKFNLSKLGTDYIVNNICMHYKEECIGSYPDNYVFVNEPKWPTEGCLTDRTPLKRKYSKDEV